MAQVMGILNVTPDSFSGDGVTDLEQAFMHAKGMAEGGADVLDVGGESTAYWKKDYTPVPAEQELRRVLPVLQRLRAELPAIPLSIDTRKPEVARAALSAGASWLNDVEGVSDDGSMARLAAEAGARFVIMHNSHQASYADVVSEVREELARAAEHAQANGVPAGNIVLDPGLGFGKTGQHNLQILHRLPEIVSLGYPVLVGPSRKRFLGQLLGTPEQDRVEGTAAAIAIAIAHGASVVRVHDVPQMVRVARVAEAIARAN